MTECPTPRCGARRPAGADPSAPAQQAARLVLEIGSLGQSGVVFPAFPPATFAARGRPAGIAFGRRFFIMSRFPCVSGCKTAPTTRIESHGQAPSQTEKSQPRQASRQQQGPPAEAERHPHLISGRAWRAWPSEPSPSSRLALVHALSKAAVCAPLARTPRTSSRERISRKLLRADRIRDIYVPGAKAGSQPRREVARPSTKG